MLWTVIYFEIKNSQTKNEGTPDVLFVKLWNSTLDYIAD